MPPNRPSRHLDRSNLPDEFTPETVRAMGMWTARQLARPDNGVLTEREQAEFDAALREVLKAPTDRLGRAVGRARRDGTPVADPDLRRSYQRTRRRLDAQAARTRQAFPELTRSWDVVEGEPGSTTDIEPEPEPEVTTAADGPSGTDDVSVGTLEAEIEQTSDTLEILEQIAAIQAQQLENQRSQLLNETRGVFFALAVSVAVIIAGVAPLVAASPHDRWLILMWTAIVCVLGGIVYAVVRAVQLSRSAAEDRTESR